MEERKIKVVEQDDGVILTFIKSIIGEDNYHVIIEFTELDDYDHAYLTGSEVAEIYNIKL